MRYLNNFTKFNEKLVLVNYDEYAKLVADAYEAAPEYDEKILPSYRALIDQPRGSRVRPLKVHTASKCGVFTPIFSNRTLRAAASRSSSSSGFKKPPGSAQSPFSGSSALWTSSTWS